MKNVTFFMQKDAEGLYLTVDAKVMSNSCQMSSQNVKQQILLFQVGHQIWQTRRW